MFIAAILDKRLALPIFLVLAAAIIASFSDGLQKEDDSAAPVVKTVEPEIEAPARALLPQTSPDTTAPAQPVRIPILIYHSVRPDLPSDSAELSAWSITPEIFELQLAHLKDNGYTTVSLDYLVSAVARGTTSPVMKPVILTFDDGWRNQYEYAFPLLKKYGMTATFYVFTNPTGWHESYITWDELREMDAAGMTIASHTITHPLLSKLTPEELDREFANSKERIEKEIGKPVGHLAMPFGYSSEAVNSAIIRAGYVTGRGIQNGAYHSVDSLLSLTGFFVRRPLSDFIWMLDTE